MRIFPSTVGVVVATIVSLTSCAGSTQAAVAAPDGPDSASEYVPA